DRLLAAWIETKLGWDELVDVDAVERPAMGRRARKQLVTPFGQGHVERFFATLPRGHQELQRKRGLARSGPALDQVNASARKAARENVVERFAASGNAGLRPGNVLRCHEYPIFPTKRPQLGKPTQK